MENTDKLVLTVTKAGKMLGLSRPTAFRMAHEGKIPIIRMGRKLLVPKSALLKMLENAGEPAPAKS